MLSSAPPTALMRPDYCRQLDYRPRSRTSCHQYQRMPTFPTMTL
ncbi:hypothetical protein IEO21_11094 [Rhodonia placenta]|uniref:Uncharacterized protein n=1 Tax=Rhodonia placenta TaxID=104341 RepID=A0A8H7TV43_9APHY|nr:hypothetical protein IEO21_11094 [Postia placenta]